jgi:succinoglycan biosynthesis protein ExoM
MQDDDDLVVIAICTRDRNAKLERALREIAKITVPPRVGVRVQVIDNSLDGTARETALMVGPIHDGVTYCHRPDGGIPRARNAAIRERKRNEHLVFIDDDQWPDRSWLLRLWHVHEAYPSAIIGGKTHQIREGGDRTPTQEISVDGKRVDACASGNSLLPAGLFDTNQLTFSPRYRRSGGEDTDFCFRAASLGVVTRFASSAVCFEDHGKERYTVPYRMKLCFTHGAIYSDIVRRQRRRRIPYRLGAIITRALIGLCKLPLAVCKSGKRSSGVEDLSLAAGGFIGLFGYLPQRYP